MITRTDCAAARELAGAIAVGDASDNERDAYRAHVAACRRCLQELGGEREIERVMAIVGQARDEERWSPDLRPRLAARQRRHQGWIWGAALAATTVLIVGVRTLEKPHPPTVTRVISAQEARALAALDTQTVVRREGRAEFLAVGTKTLSTSFQVSVDQRGIPVRCTITRSSGVRSLDASVCRAAMHTHYGP